MRNEDPGPVDLFGKIIPIDLHTQIFAQETAEPEIMIPGNKNQPTTVLSEISQFFQYREILFNNYISPGEPQIKYIAVQYKYIGFFFDGNKKIYDLLLMLFFLLFIRKFKMAIGNYIYIHDLFCHQVMENVGTELKSLFPDLGGIIMSIAPSVTNIGLVSIKHH